MLTVLVGGSHVGWRRRSPQLRLHHSQALATLDSLSLSFLICTLGVMTRTKCMSVTAPSTQWLCTVSLRPPLLAPPCSGDQIVGATIYFDNLQSGEVTQLLSTMGHHAVGLKLHRRGDRSPEPGQTWTHGVFSSHGSEVVLVSASPARPCPESAPRQHRLAGPAPRAFCPPTGPLLSFLLLISPPLSLC